MLKKLLNSNKKLVVEFTAIESNLDIIPHPARSYKYMPEWFHKLKPQVKKNTIIQPSTAKKCVPVLDAVSQGYMIPLWCDMYIRVAKRIIVLDNKDRKIGEILDNGILDSELIGSPIEDIKGKPAIVDKVIRDGTLGVKVETSLEKIRGNISINGHKWEQVGDLCDLKKFTFGKTILKFMNPWSIKTPKGWSVQFKNPANNWSNNIHILEGVVDTDEYFLPINFPFIWTGNEEGEWIIPKGTPLVQVIPFKRTDIDMSVGIYNERKEAQLNNRFITMYKDRYRKLCWHKRNKSE